jgi:polyisoprenyl-teichoic acid--peptidoglycan teichoic acid transferase
LWFSRKHLTLKIIVTVMLLGGLVAGILNFHAMKTWASRRYFSIRMESVVIPEGEVSMPKWVDPSKPLNILFIGTDKGSIPGEEGYTRSDVMILASINVEKKKAVLVSIPRDTKVTIPGYGTQKINAAHSFSGPQGAIDAVKSISGFEIHHYAEVDLEAFKKVVDALGGVPFHVDYTIKDPLAGYLPKGDYILNGDQALILCRARETLPRGDLDRIDNQKKFLKAVMQKAVGIRDIQSLLGILDAAVQYLQTTMRPDMIFDLAKYLQGMQVDDVEFTTLPGDSPVPPAGQPWYFVYDPQAAAQLFSNIKTYCSTKPPEEKNDLAEQVNVDIDRSAVRLKVLNGARWEGMAAKVAETMKDKGYTQVESGNSTNVYPNTTIYYSPNQKDQALAVAYDLNPNGDYVFTEDAYVASSNKADVVLVIGKDYTSP